MTGELLRNIRKHVLKIRIHRIDRIDQFIVRGGTIAFDGFGDI